MDYHTQVRTSFEKQKFMNHLNAELKSVREGFCEIQVPFNLNLTQQNEYFHAGVIGTIADTASGYAAYSLMQEEDSVLTVEYKLNLISPAKGEFLVARSNVIKAGKTLTVCSANVYSRLDGNESLCATALVTLIALRNYKER